MDTLKVRDAKDVEDVVRAAIAGEQPLEIIGHGSKRLIGQPMATNALLDLSSLNAVTSYEPNELIITVQAGAPLADVKSLIDSKNQQFAFEPVLFQLDPEQVGAFARLPLVAHRDQGKQHAEKDRQDHHEDVPGQRLGLPQVGKKVTALRRQDRDQCGDRCRQR